jgi:hypothetical protein
VAQATITRERIDGVYTVRVSGTYSWPEANVAACSAVAERLGLATRYSVRPDRAWMLVRNIRQQQRQRAGYGYVDSWTVTVRAGEPSGWTVAVAR